MTTLKAGGMTMSGFCFRFALMTLVIGALILQAYGGQRRRNHRARLRASRSPSHATSSPFSIRNVSRATPATMLPGSSISGA